MTIPDVSGTPLADLVSLAGRTAVVTGGAMGIGAAIVRRLAEAGADVLLGDLAADAGAALASEVAGATGRRVLARHCDVRDASSVTDLAETAASELGGPHIWVNNAGIYPGAPVLEMPTGEWDRVLEINLRGTFLGAREAAGRMARLGHGGVIVNVASTAGFEGVAGISHYVASKHGVVGLTKALALELGPMNIRVLGVAPTMILTPGVEAGADALRAAGVDMLGDFGATVPLGRPGVPDDVARVVLFCASDLSLLMTGSTLLVDAGALAG